MIDRNTVQKILDTAEIVDVVSDFVTLKRRGANYIACCPFHNEKTPSFSVSPSKGIFKCFGCGKAGSAVTFVMEQEHLTYSEALKYLGKKYGIEVVEKEETEEDTQERLRHESLLVVSEFARQFYTDTLFHTDAGRAIGLSYFRQARGFSDETIKKFGLGFSPDPRKMEGTTTLAAAAQKAGYKREYLIATGLCIERNDKSLADKFYDRVMFPIHSLSGRVIAFGGRTLLTDKSVAKYVNSPETEIYHKSDVLYGIYQAKSAIAKLGKCYLVEGYTDVISFHQAGIENVVASSGTSLTQGQIRLIKRFTNKITVLYDGDPAGIKASIRGIDMLLEEGMEVKVALFPDGHDPDSFARSHSVDQITKFLDEAETDFIDFKYELLAKDIAKDPLRKAGLIKEIVRTISLIPDRIVRTVYIEQSAQKLDVKQEILSQEVSKTRRDNIISGEDAKRKSEEREARRKELEKTLPAEEVPPQTNTPQAAHIDPEVPFLEPYEKEILYYLVKFGEHIIHFEEHMIVGSEQPVQEITVSEYISAELEYEKFELQNSVLKKVYDLYFEHKEQEGKNGQMEKWFANHPDKHISQAVIDLIYQKHSVNIKEFQRTLVPEENLIGKYVPKIILVYKTKVIEYTYNLLIKQLGQAQQENNIELQNELMQQIQILMPIKNQFSKELKRLT
ncbi:MAG: DNA primase [Bacteroidales bacterium]|nr:DNA primase [Bacteroidales bacterium]